MCKIDLWGKYLIDRREKAGFDGQLWDRSRKNKFYPDFFFYFFFVWKHNTAFDGGRLVLSTIYLNTFVVFAQAGWSWVEVSYHCFIYPKTSNFLRTQQLFLAQLYFCRAEKLWHSKFTLYMQMIHMNSRDISAWHSISFHLLITIVNNYACWH